MEEMTIYLNYLALVEHEYFYYASVFWRMKASHVSTVALKALVGIHGQQEEALENKAIWWETPE